MPESFYDVLGVSVDASTDEITAAYRERLKETHPDVSDETDAEDQTRRVIEAKEVLTDEDERARYDRLGHEAYVSGSDVDADWSSHATATAATVDADSDGETRREPGPGPGAESVDEGTWASTGPDPETGGSGQTGTGETTASASANAETERRTGPEADRGSAGTGRGSRGSNSSRNVGDAVGWAAGIDGRHAVRNSQQRGGIHRSRLFPSQQSLVLLVSTFIAYPSLVFSTFYPGFPLLVNVVVGVCTLLVIGYLMSMPEVGVYVFGGWTVLATLATVAYGPPLLVGVVMLGTTWLPLGFTLITYWVLNW